MEFCPKCWAPEEFFASSAKEVRCTQCNKKIYGLNYQYHIVFILAPVIVGFLYCLARTMY